MTDERANLGEIEPRIVDEAERPYAGIRGTVTMQTIASIGVGPPVITPP